MVVECPECGKKLRLSSGGNSGKRIKCPGCAAVFAPGADDAEQEQPRRVARGTVKPTKRAPDPDEDEEEEELDRDRSRGRRGRGRDDEEEDDDRPARRKRESRGRDSGDDDDDQPRSRRKKRKKQGAPVTLWIVLGGAVVLVAILVVVIVLIVRGGGSGAYAQHEAAANELIGLIKELQAAFESVQDANSARTAATKINSVIDRVQALHQRTRTLGKITAEENRRLEQKIQAELMPMQASMTQAAFQAGMRSQGEPTFIAAAKRLESLRNLR